MHVLGMSSFNIFPHCLGVKSVLVFTLHPALISYIAFTVHLPRANAYFANRPQPAHRPAAGTPRTCEIAPPGGRDKKKKKKTSAISRIRPIFTVKIRRDSIIFVRCVGR